MKNYQIIFRALALSFFIFAIACENKVSTQISQSKTTPQLSINKSTETAEIQSDEIRKILENAVEQTKLTKTYDSAYVVLPYPMGDVPINTGVCTDVVIRALRKAGVDLQKEVHEDMSKNFSVYPKKWGLPKADSNIDHRRVPNLQTYFTRKGKSLEITNKAVNYKPGDIVSWDLNGKGLTHIGLVSNIWNNDKTQYLIIHNIGSGAKAEDVLFEWKVTGHFRYF